MARVYYPSDWHGESRIVDTAKTGSFEYRVRPVLGGNHFIYLLSGAAFGAAFGAAMPEAFSYFSNELAQFLKNNPDFLSNLRVAGLLTGTMSGALAGNLMFHSNRASDIEQLNLEARLVSQQQRASK